MRVCEYQGVGTCVCKVETREVTCGDRGRERERRRAGRKTGEGTRGGGRNRRGATGREGENMSATLTPTPKNAFCSPPPLGGWS